MTKQVEEFWQMLRLHQGGYVVYFDLADTKRRNCFLGLKRVDADISEFDSLLQKLFVFPDICKRVAGDHWAAYVKDDSLPLLGYIVICYARSSNVRIGWRCVAPSFRDWEREAYSVKSATLNRAVRCGFTPFWPGGPSTKSWERLVQTTQAAPVNKPTLVPPKDTPLAPRVPWQCVDHQVESMKCAFCHSDDLEWFESCGVFSGDAKCRQCGAELQFEEYCKLESD